MKKFALSICFCLALVSAVYAENFPNLKYKNIGQKDKISYNATSDTWSRKVDKKSGNYGY